MYYFSFSFLFCAIFILLSLNQGFNYFNAEYKLKTRCTVNIVIPQYDVGHNIPKLILFDTAQRYIQQHTPLTLHTYVHITVT